MERSRVRSAACVLLIMIIAAVAKKGWSGKSDSYSYRPAVQVSTITQPTREPPTVVQTSYDFVSEGELAAEETAEK